MTASEISSGGPQIVGKLAELMKKQPPPQQQMATTTSFSMFAKPTTQTQPAQTPPLLQVQGVTAEILRVASLALNNSECVVPLQQYFQKTQFQNTFIFLGMKQFLPTQTIQATSYYYPSMQQQRPDRNYIECQLVRALLFVVELAVFAHAEIADLQQNICGLIQQLQMASPCQQVVYDLCKCVALLQLVRTDPGSVIYLLSVPVLPFFTNQPTKEQIVIEIQQQQILVHFDKLKEEFFKRFSSLKEIFNQQILPFQSSQAVPCPFGEYEKETNKDESAKKMRIDPLMYYRLVDGINGLLGHVREEVCYSFSEQSVQFSYSLYNLNWLPDCQEYFIDMELFCLVYVLKFLYLSKNDYIISSYTDSVVDESPYELLYAKQYDFIEQLIRETTDKIIAAMTQMRHNSDRLNSFYENLIATLIDASSYDSHKLSIMRDGKEVRLDLQLLGIVFFIQTIQDTKFFLNLSLQSVDFTQPLPYKQQTVLQYLLQQALDSFEFNSAFGVDILQLLQAAMSHSQEYTRQFMSSNRSLKLQDIQFYLYRNQQHYGSYQIHPKIVQKMHQLCNRISNQDIYFQLANYSQLMKAPDYSYYMKMQVQAQLVEQLKQQYMIGQSQIQQVLSFYDPNLNQQQQLTNLNQLAQLALQGQQIFLETREQSLVDTVLQPLTPAQTFTAMTDILVKLVYDIPMTDVVFTFNDNFDVLYLAFLSNPKYFVSRCLIQLTEFFKQVSNTTVSEMLAANNTIVYDYSCNSQLRQVSVQSHAVWLELLCSPQIDVTIMYRLSELLDRFKAVGVNNYQQQLFIYKQVFNKFQMLMVNNKISATALLRIFQDLDQLLYSPEIRQFATNFMKIFNFDLKSSGTVFKELNETAVVYYSQLFMYLQNQLRKDNSLEIIFNILKFGKSNSIYLLLQSYFANLYGLINLQTGTDKLIQEQTKFIITILTNCKQNAFSQHDSGILLDIYYYFFNEQLQTIRILLHKLTNPYSKYLLSFLLIIMLEQYNQVHFEDNALQVSLYLAQTTLRALFQQAESIEYAVDIENKLLVLFHLMKSNVKQHRYAAVDCKEFSAAIVLIASLSQHKIFMLNLISQLLELQLFCHYHYDSELDLSFADDFAVEDQVYQSYVCILTREIALNLATALQQQYPLSGDTLSMIVYLQNLTNFCCISKVPHHSLYYCIVQPLKGVKVDRDPYTHLLLARIGYLTDRVSLSGAPQPEQPEFDFFMQTLAQHVQKQQLSEPEMLSLSKLYSNAIAGFRVSDNPLFLCSIDALGMSSYLVNTLYVNAEQEVFENTLSGVLCQKIITFIYLNFYAARNGRLKLNLAQARSVVRLNQRVIALFREQDSVVGRMCDQLNKNQFGA